MFTGLVEARGEISALQRTARGAIIRIKAPEKMISKLQLGESVAVDGVCLTVTRWGGQYFTADLSLESLRCTTFLNKSVGDIVHLERALRLGDRLGGHMVTGHVDGLGTIVDRRQDGDAVSLQIEAGPQILVGLVHKGSVCLDGVSLTINRLDGQIFEVCLVNHTQAVVYLHEKRMGEQVHIETDIIGKYVYRLLGENRTKTHEHKETLNLQFLQETGFIK